MSRFPESRTYPRLECAVFRKTAESFGGLSNMAPGFPVRVNGVRIPTVEALYQACRFPHRPEVQQLIIGQNSPMTAKMVSKPYRKDSRPDWDRVRVRVMRWCLRLKLTQHWPKFSQLLLSTGDRPIVEDSRKDDFWGAIPTDPNTLVGMNVLGRLLMELRDAIKHGAELRRVEAPAVTNFLLLGEPLQVVDFRTDKSAAPAPIVAPSDDGLEEPTLPLFTNAATPTLGDSHATVRRHSQGSPLMLASLKPYPEYKESGLAWLGGIPRHWKSGPGFAAFREKQVKNKGMQEKTVLSLSFGHIVVKPPEKLHGLVPDSFETYQIVDPGDIIIRSTDLQNDWNSLRVGLVRNRGIITSAYLCFRTTGTLSPEYGYHLLHAFDLMKVFYGLGSGLRQNLDWGDFKRMLIFMPPPEEQAAIVRFLNHANGQIDRAIRAKRKLIALLNEQKQAIIHRAVTRGLDLTVPLKPSGIPWLGDIPKHWEICQLRRLIKYGTSITYGIVQAGPDIEGGIPYIRTSDMKGQTLPRTGYLRTSNAIDSSYKRSKVESGDLVVAIRATLGKGLVVPDYLVGANLTQGTARISPGERLSSQFLCAAFNSKYCQESIRMVAKGTTFLEITLGDLRQIPLAIPPMDEQALISARLAEDLNPLDRALTRAEREITLLREYRTRLTADVVTGKLDVRPAVRHLPAAPVEPKRNPRAGDSPEPESEEVENAEN